MTENEVEVEEKRRVAKASAIILVSEIFDRYSTAAISSKSKKEKIWKYKNNEGNRMIC